MDPRQWLAHLEQFGIKLGLETISELTDALGEPHRAYPVIHVAGTNGKGSVSAMAARGLSVAGHRTGLYTSPHLVRLEERFRLDGTPAPAELLDGALTDVRRAVERLTSSGRLHVEPTFFEATTAAAFLLFARAGVDAAVIEVGLGGRFDATNIVSPAVCAITSVDLDHQAQLGASLAEIAAEKGGIIKPGVPVVTGRLAPEAAAVIERICAERGAPLLPAAIIRSRTTGDDGHERVALALDTGDSGEVRLSLAGSHQAGNAAVAARVLEVAGGRGLRVGPGDIADALATTRWAGRLQTVATTAGRVVVDGAHNPAGARALASYLERCFPAGVPIVFGAMRDKAVAEMIAALTPAARPFIFIAAPGGRAATPDELAAAARDAAADRIETADSLRDALARARALAPDVVVAGSLYLAGEALDLLGAAVD